MTGLHEREMAAELRLRDLLADSAKGMRDVTACSTFPANRGQRSDVSRDLSESYRGSRALRSTLRPAGS